MEDFENRLTVIIETSEGIETYSTTRMPLTRSDAIDWFENQVLPAIGYGVGDKDE